MELEVFSKEDYVKMAEYGCRMHRVYVSLTGDGAMTALDTMAKILCGGEEWWMRKVNVMGSGGIEMELVSWGSEEGMVRWMKRYSGDIRWVVKGF